MIKEAIIKISDGEHLTYNEAEEVMPEDMWGEWRDGRRRSAVYQRFHDLRVGLRSGGREDREARQQSRFL